MLFQLEILMNIGDLKKGKMKKKKYIPGLVCVVKPLFACIALEDFEDEKTQTKFLHSLLSPAPYTPSPQKKKN